MGKIHIISDDTPNPQDEMNVAVVNKLQSILHAIPGGSELLDDSTQKGDITINLTSRQVAGGAHWDNENRRINLQFMRGIDLFLIELQTTKTNELDTYGKYLQSMQLEALSSILFELCNAANPLLNDPSNNNSPLAFPSTESYARDQEFREFKSFQRRASIVNAGVRTLGWDEDYRIPVYEDSQFEQYFKEQADKAHEVYGEQLTHANYYREGFRRAFIATRNTLADIMLHDVAEPHLKYIASNQEVQMPGQKTFDAISKLQALSAMRSLEDFEHLEVDEARRTIDQFNMDDFKTCRTQMEFNVKNHETIIRSLNKRSEKLVKTRITLENLLKIMDTSLATMLQVPTTLDIVVRSIAEIDTLKAALEKTIASNKKSIEELSKSIEIFTDFRVLNDLRGKLLLKSFDEKSKEDSKKFNTRLEASKERRKQLNTSQFDLTKQKQPETDGDKKEKPEAPKRLDRPT